MNGSEDAAGIFYAVEQGIQRRRDDVIRQCLRSRPRPFHDLLQAVVVETGTAEVDAVHDRIVEMVREQELVYGLADGLVTLVGRAVDW